MSDLLRSPIQGDPISASQQRVLVRIAKQQPTAENHGRDSVGIHHYDRTDEKQNLFWAKITGCSTLGNNRFSYNFLEVDKTAAGYGGWSTWGDGETGTAYNTIEDMNDGSGIEGNGVDVSAPDFAGFFIAPAPVGAIVMVEKLDFYASGTEIIEYWFQYENGIRGTCPTP